MADRPGTQTDAASWARRMVFHVACILALAWPGLLNGQPFFFPDTTAYVRSADVAAYLFSGKRISTEWTHQYRAAIEPPRAAPVGAAPVVRHGNDLASGSVMAGRSPYFGAILWISYVVSRFWLFVLAQAVLAYALIRLSLRAFDLLDRRKVAVTVASLALLTTLPFYTSLLMPDLLAAFGVLGFLLLTIDQGRLSRCERAGLAVLIVGAAVSHPMHAWLIASMALVLLVRGLLARQVRRHRAVIGVAALALVLGLLSSMVTGLVVQRHFGRSPQLVPLLTARFLADGPGAAYLRTHCPQAGFAVCAYRDRPAFNAQAFLWSNRPGEGGYLLATPAARAAMAAQDSAFAWAVLKAYPFEQGLVIIGNGAKQLVTFETSILNNDCAIGWPCRLSLPPAERERFASSLGGRNLWPQVWLSRLHHMVAAVALVALLAWIALGRDMRDRRSRDLLLWLGLLAVAMIVNALLGGGVSEAQTRYQARIIWLLPLFAILAAMLWRGRLKGERGR